MEEELKPILLFKVRFQGETQETLRGVYYLPQYGVGMEGLEVDGSVRSVARHIANTPQYVGIEAGVVDPGELTEEAIIAAIRAWISSPNTLEPHRKNKRAS